MLNSAAVFRTDLQTNERRKPGGLAAPVCFLESQPPVDESSTKDGHRPAGGPGHAADSERLPQQLRRRSNELMPRTALAATGISWWNGRKPFTRRGAD